MANIGEPVRWFEEPEDDPFTVPTETPAAPEVEPAEPVPVGAG